jgi:hypothetical protein
MTIKLYTCENKCGAKYTHDMARDHLMNRCPLRKMARRHLPTQNLTKMNRKAA